MPNDLRDTWNTIATMWDHWAPPLRPNVEDISILESSLGVWSSDGYAPIDGYAQAVLLGVTPEIATMNFSTPTNLLAIDRSEAMIQHVWPGDISNQRTAVRGDWINYHIENKSKNIVLADGSLLFFNPDGVSRLATKVSLMLDSKGIFLARCFVMPERRETVTTILHDVRDGYSDGYHINFHEFKFRVAMALQRSFEEGVSQDDVWKAVQMILRVSPNNGFPPADVATIDVYKGKTARHHFPTVSELTTILNTRFSTVTVVKPTYQFGECCQTFIAQSPR